MHQNVVQLLTDDPSAPVTMLAAVLSSNRDADGDHIFMTMEYMNRPTRARSSAQVAVCLTQKVYVVTARSLYVILTYREKTMTPHVCHYLRHWYTMSSTCYGTDTCAQYTTH